MRFLRENGLSVFFLVIFLAALTGQAFVGHGLFNEDQLRHTAIRCRWAAT